MLEDLVIIYFDDILLQTKCLFVYNYQSRSSLKTTQELSLLIVTKASTGTIKGANQ